MKRVQLTQGYVAFVDDADYDRVAALKWYANVHRRQTRVVVYAARTEWCGGLKTGVFLHRFVLDAPAGAVIDHEDGDGLNCQRHNLRIGSTAENLCNIRTPPTGQISARGVTLNRHGFFQSSIQFHGRARQLGTFDRIEDAVAAYEYACALRDDGRFGEIKKSGLARVQANHRKRAA